MCAVRQRFPAGSWTTPSAERIVALRKRLKLSRQKFADRFGLDVRAVQDWEQGRRVPDRAARVLLTVIDHDPDSVVRALGAEGRATGDVQTATRVSTETGPLSPCSVGDLRQKEEGRRKKCWSKPTRGLSPA